MIYTVDKHHIKENNMTPNDKVNSVIESLDNLVNGSEELEPSEILIKLLEKALDFTDDPGVEDRITDILEEINPVSLDEEDD